MGETDGDREPSNSFSTDKIKVTSKEDDSSDYTTDDESENVTSEADSQAKEASAESSGFSSDEFEARAAVSPKRTKLKDLNYSLR